MHTHWHRVGIDDREREGDEKENEDMFDGINHGKHANFPEAK